MARWSKRSNRSSAMKWPTRRSPVSRIALVDGGETVWASGFRLSQSIRQRPATAETVYRVGFLAKLVTAIGVMQLMEEGKVALDSPVTMYLPDFHPAQHSPDADHDPRAAVSSVGAGSRSAVAAISTPTTRRSPTPVESSTVRKVVYAPGLTSNTPTPEWRAGYV